MLVLLWCCCSSGEQIQEGATEPAPVTRTAIFIAAARGDLENVKALLKDNPGLVFSKDEHGGTPLLAAADGGYENVAQLLLSNKADVNHKNNGGNTPLHWAAYRGHKAMAELLLANGADVNSENNDGDTPLHFAAYKGYRSVVELLLANKAGVNVKNNIGRTPMDRAMENGYKDVAELLLQHGGGDVFHASTSPGSRAAEAPATQAIASSTNTSSAAAAMFDAVAVGNLEAVQALLRENSALVSFTDNHGLTPMHVAALLGNNQMAQLLLSNRGQIFAKCNDGKTPSQLAASAGHKDLADLLSPTNLLPPKGPVNLDALLRIFDGAEKAGACGEITNALREFLTQSTDFADTHPEQLNLWAARAIACRHLDYPGEGWLAGRRLKESGAIHSDDPKMQRVLAILKVIGWLGERRTYRDWTKRTLEQIKAAANNGDEEAQSEMGELHRLGQLGFARDDSAAAKWYHQAADQGDAESQTHLGLMYENGWGVEKDYGQAVNWYRKAAKAGDSGAQLNLGNMYFNGFGVEKDNAEALNWYRKSAEAGNSAAEYYVACMYENGFGVEKDFSLAIRWCRKAAEQTNAEAQCNMGLLYENGWGVEKDRAQAANWYRKAAAQGNSSARAALQRLSSSTSTIARPGAAGTLIKIPSAEELKRGAKIEVITNAP
jgi:TPR repeat protein/ankyrin repeat protein